MTHPASADVLRPDFNANAMKHYQSGYRLLLLHLSGYRLKPSERAAAMRASFTQQRLLNEARALSARLAQS